MGAVKHLSIRLPWRDQPWDKKVRAHPLDNSSWLLLESIGAKRDDDCEVKHALEDVVLGVDKPAWTATAEAITGTAPAVSGRRAGKKSAKRP